MDASNNLIPFEFEGRAFRHEMRGEDPWFVLGDVCGILDLENISMAIERLEGDDISSTDVIDSAGRKQEMKIVSLPGLFDLIMGSRKPIARPFQRFVTHEVLVAIFKTGSYISPGGIPMVPANRVTISAGDLKDMIDGIRAAQRSKHYMDIDIKVLQKIRESMRLAEQYVRTSMKAFGMSVEAARKSATQGVLELTGIDLSYWLGGGSALALEEASTEGALRDASTEGARAMLERVIGEE